MDGTLGIVVGGGPAPGINGVISAVTIEAIDQGMKVLGIIDGFKYLASDGAARHVQPLTIDDVSRIHLQGGSLLRTSRVNVTRDAQGLKNVMKGLRSLGITHLVTIGGEGTAALACKLALEAGGLLRLVHIPKTIDNDLPLPGNMPTFGYETARHVGANLVANLIEDSKTTRRWFFVVVMGRMAGHLALGITKAAGATLSVIPEEFEGEVALDRVCDILEGAIIKRLAMEKDYGVAVIAEGVAGRLRQKDLQAIEDAQPDEHGHLRLADIGFAEFLKRRVEKSLKERGIQIPITDKNVGYELRCAPPIPFDTEYTRDLGYAAVKFLAQGGSGAMAALLNGKSTPLPLADIVDPATGRARLRLVDTRSDSYEVALNYMIRLRLEDFKSQESVSRLSRSANMETNAFESRFKTAAV